LRAGSVCRRQIPSPPPLTLTPLPTLNTTPPPPHTTRFLPDKAIDLIDEAAAKLKMEITSKPTALDEVDRRVLQLEMERLSLTKAAPNDRGAAARLGALDSELVKLKEKQSAITEMWQSEKGEMTKLQAIKEEIERVNLEVQQAERDYDLNRWGGWGGGGGGVGLSRGLGVHHQFLTRKLFLRAPLESPPLNPNSTQPNSIQPNQPPTTNPPTTPPPLPTAGPLSSSTGPSRSSRSSSRRQRRRWRRARAVSGCSRRR